MVKKSIQLGAALLLALAFVLSSCEGPVGPAGPATEGKPSTVPGTEGYTPAATIAVAGTLFEAGITKVYLSAIDANAVSVIVRVPNGATFLVPILTTLGGAGRGIVVESGGTLLISAAVTIATGGVEVENGGILTVKKGGVLIANSTSPLTVKNGATVTVEADGALGSAVAVTYTGGTLDTSFKASKIGNAAVFTAPTVLDYGPITFQPGAWYYTGVADGSEITAAKGFSVTDKIWMGATLASLTSTIADDITATRTLYVPGTITSIAATTLAGKVTAGTLTGTATPATLTVSGELNVGTVSAFSTNATLVTSGTGKIVIGAITASTNNLIINGDVTITGAATITAGKTLTVSAGKTLKIDGTAGAASVLVTESSGGSFILSDAASSIEVLGTGNRKITLSGAGDLEATGSSATVKLDVAADGLPSIILGTEVVTLTGSTITLQGATLTLANGKVLDIADAGGVINADGNSTLAGGTGTSEITAVTEGSAFTVVKIILAEGATVTGTNLIAQFPDIFTATKVKAADAGTYTWKGTTSVKKWEK
jgi:hypothetical protein